MPTLKTQAVLKAAWLSLLLLAVQVLRSPPSYRGPEGDPLSGTNRSTSAVLRMPDRVAVFFPSEGCSPPAGDVEATSCHGVRQPALNVA